jgi:hypothetical protein
VKCQFQQAQILTPAAVISTHAARGDIAILADNSTSELPLEDPEIGSSDPNIPIDINCTNGELHCGIPVGYEDYDDECDEIDESDAITTGSQRQWAASELGRFDLGTSDVDGSAANDASAKCKSVRKPHANLPDTPVDVTGAPKEFPMLAGLSGAKQNAL